MKKKKPKCVRLTIKIQGYTVLDVDAPRINYLSKMLGMDPPAAWKPPYVLVGGDSASGLQVRAEYE